MDAAPDMLREGEVGARGAIGRGVDDDEGAGGVVRGPGIDGGFGGKNSGG